MKGRSLTYLLFGALLVMLGIERNPKAGGYKTAAIPAGAGWWFLNPYTVGE
ncbi:MAG: hypothetical protein KGZ60_04345 [Truepera sp.]|nr:hypothetical protein [Truepera sp.]